jgi:ProP effector
MTRDNGVTVDRQKAKETIKLLAERWPRCFFLWGYQRRPLRIGILDDLLPLVSLGEDDLKAALRRYTAANGYLRACIEGADRVGLDGNAAGTVDAKHAAHAQKVLAERERRRLKKQEKQAKEKATQRPQTTAAMGSEPTERRPPMTPSAPQQPPSTPRRLGFAGLRAAAAQRKARG